MYPKLQNLHQRLRHFADHLIDEEMRTYREAGIDIPYRWHSILQILQEKKQGLTISDLAEIQEKTHPDVVYTINQMVKEGMVHESDHSTDKRKRLISLTDKAKETISLLKPMWAAVHDATNTWLREIAPDLILNIEALNQSLEQNSLYSRIRHEKKKTDLKNLQIIPASDIANSHQIIMGFQNNFKAKYFYIPEIEAALQNLSTYIKKHEANAYLISNKGNLAGTTILFRRSFHIAEIVFLFVDEEHRRRYFAHALLMHLIKVAHEIGVSQLFIQSHPKLVGLNALLKNNGFVLQEQMIGSSVKYKELPLILVKQI